MPREISKAETHNPLALSRPHIASQAADSSPLAPKPALDASILTSSLVKPLGIDKAMPENSPQPFRGRALKADFIGRSAPSLTWL